MLSMDFVPKCRGGGTELTGKDLEGSSEEEASTLLQSEKLAEEEEERQAAEDDGQDHESLDRLDPLCRGRREKKESVVNNRPTVVIIQITIHILH